MTLCFTYEVTGHITSSVIVVSHTHHTSIIRSLKRGHLVTWVPTSKDVRYRRVPLYCLLLYAELYLILYYYVMQVLTDKQMLAFVASTCMSTKANNW